MMKLLSPSLLLLVLLLLGGKLQTIRGGNDGHNNQRSCHRTVVEVCEIDDGTNVTTTRKEEEFVMDPGHSTHDNDDDDNDYDESNNDEERNNVIKLRILTHNYSSFTKGSRDRFISSRHGTVEVEYVEVPFRKLGQLNDDILNEVQSRVGLYDGFIAPPLVSGSVFEYDGYADLTGFIQESSTRLADWADILLVWRKMLGQYENKIVMYPVDNDAFFLYYRQDVLDHYGLHVPRTWDEYNQVAAALHGKVYENKTLNGSCIGRIPHCTNYFMTDMILATMTQTKGPWEGHLFDTSDMKPLAGPAMAKTLEWLEGQVQYGHPEEFDFCVPLNRKKMNEGVCALSINAGNTYDAYLFGDDSVFEEHSNSTAKLGVARTPGSTHVLDRQTMELVPCTLERCPYADYFPDIGLVNYAPTHFLGWACSVNNYTSPKKKRLTMEFCSFIASKEQTKLANIYDANGPKNQVIGGSPFRESLLDPELYLAKGYGRETTELYLEAVKYSLDHPNARIDMRFPQASQIGGVIDTDTHEYLVQVNDGLVPLQEREVHREQVVKGMVSQWQAIITESDSQGTTRRPILETYQRIRGVYAVDHEYNYINQIAVFGYVLMALAILSALLFGTWTLYCRNTRIVRASQPFFLVMICSGAFIFAWSIFPMGIDDSKASVTLCSVACMSIPWLMACGWTIVFSAIFAKLNRVSQVMKNASHFRRVQVKERDVLKPFAIMFVLNVTILLTWTLVDPLQWKRIETSATSSYGTCTIDSDRPPAVWKVLVSLLVVLNGVALILANVEAYKIRFVSTELGETKWIAMAMGSLFQLVLVGIPLLFLVKDNPSASYFVRSSMVFVFTMSILILIFVPKIVASYKPEKKHSIMSSQWTAKSHSASHTANSSSQHMAPLAIAFTPTSGGGVEHAPGGGVDHAVNIRGNRDGLSFTIVEMEKEGAQNELEEYRGKVEVLKEALEEQGLDTEKLFATAGIHIGAGSVQSVASFE